MKIADFALSHYGSASCVSSPVARMMASFAADFRPGLDINLGVGYVNEQTIPRLLIQKALHQVLAQPEKYKVALNYGGPHGSANLIASLKKFQGESPGSGLTPEALDRNEIIIGPNGASSLLEGVALVLRPGIVITADPMYYIYCNYLERLGYDVMTVPEDRNGIRTDLLEEKLRALGPRRADISFMYIVTVNNPSCSILCNDRRCALVRLAAGLSEEIGRKVPIIFDRAYEDLVHDPAVPPLRSALQDDTLGIAYDVGTLSKVLSPALRIGYMIGADGAFLQAMIQKTSDTGFSAPLITQEIASYMLDHHLDDQLKRVRSGYRGKALAVKGWIDAMLGTHLESCCGGQAGFYYYLTFKNIHTTEGSPFFRYLTRTTGAAAIDGKPDSKNPRVLYVPGQFCVHPRGDLVEKGTRQLRLSYGFEELEGIESAISLMRRAAEYSNSVAAPQHAKLTTDTC